LQRTAASIKKQSAVGAGGGFDGSSRSGNHNGSGMELNTYAAWSWHRKSFRITFYTFCNNAHRIAQWTSHFERNSIAELSPSPLRWRRRPLLASPRKG
jgi:hypothetical protein